MNFSTNFKHIKILSNVIGGFNLLKPLNSTVVQSNALKFLQTDHNSQCHLSTSCSLNRHPGITYPRPVSRYWAICKLRDPNQYTVDALPLVRTGGRGPDGKIQYKHVTTGLNRPWFMVDHNRSRHLPTKKIYEELVLQIKKTWWRHPYIALVASGEVKRWLIATTSMKPGDIIRSHVDIPTIPVEPKEGDAYPIGALPVGTIISQFEIRPGQGAMYCRSAGASAVVLRRGKNVGLKSIEELTAASTVSNDDNDDLEDDDVVFVRRNGNSKVYRLLPACMCVVGQVSNHHHDQFKFRKFGEKKWRGIKQRSGLFQRKTGRFGRKIRPIGPPIDLVTHESSKNQFILKCSYPGLSERTRIKEQAKFEALHPRSVKRPQPVPKPHNTLPDKMPRYRWCSWSSVR